VIDSAQFSFTDEWVWLIFVVIGLLMVLLELIVGVDTGLDLVFLGSAFILGGLITWPFHSWIASLVVTLFICIAYVAIGRKYVTKWRAIGKTKTNVDTIIGKKGIVLTRITPTIDGRVKVGAEEWKGRATENLKDGDEITVTGISGVTLIVEKNKGGE
jgi:membrane protein implicated in regulation of membrane protease activity